MAKLKIETIPIFEPLSLLLNASGGGNGSFTNSEVSLRLFDIDGDGLADRVFNVSDSYNKAMRFINNAKAGGGVSGFRSPSFESRTGKPGDRVDFVIAGSINLIP